VVGLSCFLNVWQDANAVGGAWARPGATHEDDRLVRFQQFVFVTEAHRELQPVVNILLPLGRFRFYNTTPIGYTL